MDVPRAHMAGGRGGAQQRLKRRRVADAAAKPKVPSLLARFLVRMVACGTYSPQQVQKISELASRDFQKATEEEADLPELTKLSEIGDHGRRPQDCHSDLMRSLMPSPFHPHHVAWPFKAKTARGWNVNGTEVLCPHEIFATVYHSYPNQFQRAFLPSAEALHAYWEEMDTNPFYTNHGVKDIPNYRNTVIPISMHGDGVPVTGLGKSWSKSMEIISICGTLCAQGVTAFGLATNFIMWVCFEAAMSEVEGADTMARFWRILTWSLRWLYEGLDSSAYNNKGIKSDSSCCLNLVFIVCAL